jgi:hypothetical protein
MTDHPVTRKDLRNALALNAATDPTALVVAAAIAVVAIALGRLWLIPVFALPGYLALAAMTFFSEDKAGQVAEKVYGRDRSEAAPPALDSGSLAPPIALRLDDARRVLDSLLRAIDQAQLPFDDVARDARAIVTAMERTAKRAQVLHDYLDGQDAAALDHRIARLQHDGTDAELLSALQEQRAATERVAQRLERFYSEMERMTSTLATMSARLVEMSAVEEASAQRELAGQAHALREQIDALAAGMSEAYGEAGGPPSQSRRPHEPPMIP